MDGSTAAPPAHGEPVEPPAADQPGTVSLESKADPPTVGGYLRAVLIDPDGVTVDVAWTWERSADGATWETIDGTTGATYTATAEDAGYYLRATASYDDGHGPGKSAGAGTANPVLAPPPERGERQTGTTLTYLSATLIVDEGLIVAGCDSTDHPNGQLLGHGRPLRQ